MKYYPIQLDLDGAPVVVVGGGPVAERRVDGLLAAGAAVRVVAPDVTDALKAWAETDTIEWSRTEYVTKLLDGSMLAFAATNDPDVNARVARDAHLLGILVCRADHANEGNFTVPAVVVKGDLVLTVSSSGQSPTLSAVIRDDLDTSYRDYEPITAFFGSIREKLKSAHHSEHARKTATRRLLADPELRRLIAEGHLAEAAAYAEQCL